MSCEACSTGIRAEEGRPTCNYQLCMNEWKEGRTASPHVNPKFPSKVMAVRTHACMHEPSQGDAARDDCAGRPRWWVSLRPTPCDDDASHSAACTCWTAGFSIHTLLAAAHELRVSAFTAAQKHTAGLCDFTIAITRHAAMQCCYRSADSAAEQASAQSFSRVVFAR